MAEVPPIQQGSAPQNTPGTLNAASQGLQGVARYVTLFGGIIIAGIVMSLAAGPMQGVRGVPGPTLALANAPLVAGLILLGTLLVTLFVACMVGKAINAVVGLFILGTGFAVLTMQCGTIADVVFLGGSQVSLAVETLAWAVVVFFCAVVVFRVSGPLPDVPVEDPAEAFAPGTLLGADALKSALAGLLIIPVVWLLLINDLKGQSIAAVTIGSILAGMGGRLLSPRIQPILIFAAPLLAGALAHAIAVTMMDGTAQEMLVANTLPRIGRPMPLDYVAGALMGVAIGLGWSRSFVE